MKIRHRHDELSGSVVGQQPNQKNQRARVEGERGEASDTVSVGLAGAISAHLDPTKLAAERREKVERLKELVQAGKYKPSSDDVARALVEEIAYVVFDGQSGNSGDTGDTGGDR